MNINRNNYEVVFLLYVDGELSAEQKKIVELFIQENVDLKVELDMLLQTKLPFDEITFNHKDELFKIEKTSIHISNYEEYFLLYVDNELNSNEKNEVEKFVLQHPELQNEFTLLKQTQLEKEEIIFTDKSSLYRKERKPFVYLYWRRIAIAAIFIGLGVLIWNVIPSERIKAVANNLQHVKTIAQPKNTENQRIILPKDLVNNNENNGTNQIVYNKKINKRKIIAPAQETNNLVRNNSIITSNELAKNDVDVKSINSVQPENTEIAIVSNSSSINNIIPVADNTDSKNIIQPAVYKETIYKELDTDETEKPTLYIGNLEINKNKLKGFIKKAGRLFYKSKDEDAKTSIAGFPITKSSE